MIMKYVPRQKERMVDAVYYNGTNQAEVGAFLGKSLIRFIGEEISIISSGVNIWGSSGEYVVKHSSGEFYFVPKIQFEYMYEEYQESE